MVRWSSCVVLALLLLLPGSKLEEDDDDDEQSEEIEENEEEDDEEEDTEHTEKMDHGAGRSAPAVMLPTPKALIATKSAKKRPLECYVCAFKAETPIRACLDPTKYRVHTMTCPNPDDKCFTSVISKGSNYEAVIRGCRSGCVGTTDITCCELNRCNNQALAVPVMPPRMAVVTNKSNKPIPPTVLFFVTILLVLQTVVKVAI